MVNRWALRTKLVVLAGLLFVISGIGAAQTSPSTPTIDVVGVGLVTVEPDRVIVAIRIEGRDATAAGAQAKTEAVLDALKAELEAVLPGGFEVNELGLTITAAGGQPTIYRNVEVVLPDDSSVGLVYDAARKSGASDVINVRYQSTKLQEAVQEARRKAVENARANAEAMTEAMGMRILGVRSAVDANRVQMFNPSDPLLQGLVQRPSDGSTVQRGEIVVQVEVSIQYVIDYLLP